MRVALKIAYDGTHYLGSQTQTQTPNTILSNLEQVFKQLGIESRVIASGRTDKGVHASGQVCHLDLPPFWSDLKKLKRVANEMLPSSISILQVKAKEDTFHARYGAKKRVYRYIFKEGESSPFLADFVTFTKKLNRDKIQKNIKLFEGIHDFSEFMKTGSDTSHNTREIYNAYLYEHKGFVILVFEGNGFLRSQIRLMVGALLHLSTQEIQDKLDGKEESKNRPAPPNGLYLAKIFY